MATKKITLNELRTLVKQIIKEERMLNEGIKALSKEEANVYFDKTKYVLYPASSPETYIIMKAGEKYSSSAPKEGKLYTPKNNSYGKWASSQKGEGAYALEF